MTPERTPPNAGPTQTGPRPEPAHRSTHLATHLATHLGTVLVVDDDAGVRYTLRAILESEGFVVREAPIGRAALAALGSVDQGSARGPVDLVVTDIRMPELDGMGLLTALRQRPAPPPVVVITAHGSERVAVAAMKRGAADYLAKPFEPEELLRVVHRSVEGGRLRQENQRLRAALALGRTMIFASPAMREVAALVDRVAAREVTVLITGESGTGKELVARAIVRASGRASAPFVRFNAGALPANLAESELFGHARGAFTGAARARPGLFREAERGTILLDEVGELTPSTQVALLRVLQEREVRPVGSERPVPVDVRVLAATNRDLAAEVHAGRFREDLYYRLNVVPIRVPPLRERREDIVPLAQHFAERFAGRFGVGPLELAPSLLERLRDAPWPGNVRELEHTVERLVALSAGGVLGPEALDGAEGQAPLPALPLRERVAAFERGLLVEALAQTNGNQSEAARRLSVSRVTLLDKLKRYGLR